MGRVQDRGGGRERERDACHLLHLTPPRALHTPASLFCIPRSTPVRLSANRPPSSLGGEGRGSVEKKVAEPGGGDALRA